MVLMALRGSGVEAEVLRGLRGAMLGLPERGAVSVQELSEMMYTDRPDWQSVMQYVAQIYKYFETWAAEQEVDTSGEENKECYRCTWSL